LGFNRWVREWICIEHPSGSYAQRKAAEWWRKRSNEAVPATVEEAVDLARAGALATTFRVTIERKPGDQWDRIIGYELGDRPPRLESCDDLPDPPQPVGAGYGIPDEEIPF
jgi:hypothetical protein